MGPGPDKTKVSKKRQKDKIRMSPTSEKLHSVHPGLLSNFKFFLPHFGHQGASNCTKLNSAQLSGDMLMRKGTFLYKCPLSHIYNILQKISKAYKSTKRERKGNIFSNPTWKEKTLGLKIKLFKKYYTNPN